MEIDMDESPQQQPIIGIESDIDSTLLQLERLSQQEIASVDEQRLRQNINVKIVK